MANQFLSLALFLMLLSFFIVMNAVSDFEESKAAPVMNSLALAFSGQTLDQKKTPVIDNNLDIAMREGDTLEVMEGLFNAHIAGFEVKRNRLGTVMHVRADVGSFESAIDVFDINYDNISVGARGSFINSMITLLRSEQMGKPYRVDMVLNIDDDSASYKKNNPDDFIKKLKRVSGFADILERAGLPKKMLSAGLAKGDAGFIDLYFYRYKPFNMSDKINDVALPKGEL